MNTNRISAIILATALLLPLASQAIAPGESIVLDPNTGDYMITYMSDGRDEEPRLHQVRYVPPTKIDPAVKSSFEFNKDATITYGYKITNSSKSRQPIVAMRLDPVSAINASRPLPTSIWEISDPKFLMEIIIAGQDALSKPTGWRGATNPSHAGGHRISWSYKKRDTLSDGLQLGKSQGGFGFVSTDLPGIAIAEMTGNAPTPGFTGGSPDGEISDQLEKLQLNDFVPRNAAVPTILVPIPFDPALLVERIQTHTRTWVAKQLLDSAFSTQLDRYFQAAANAYRLNQPKSGNKQLQAMRELLEKQYDDLEEESEGGDDDKKKVSSTPVIDKLAARVLDFDLKYVIKRVGGDD